MYYDSEYQWHNQQQSSREAHHCVRCERIAAASSSVACQIAGFEALVVGVHIVQCIAVSRARLHGDANGHLACGPQRGVVELDSEAAASYAPTVRQELRFCPEGCVVAIVVIAANLWIPLARP